MIRKSTSLNRSFNLQNIKTQIYENRFTNPHKNWSQSEYALKSTQVHKHLLHLNQEQCSYQNYTHIWNTLSNFNPSCPTYTDIFISCGPDYDPLLPLALNFTQYSIQ